MPVTVITNPRSRLRRHFKRWANRWGTICADSFNRINADSLGTADTGHDWEDRADPSSTAPWAIRSGKAKPRVALANTHFWAYVPTGLADAVIRVRWSVGTIASPGAGIFFRGDVNGDGLLFTAIGSNQWRWSTLTAGSVTTIATVTGPTPSPGSSYLLEVRALGNDCSAYLDGVQIGATQSISTKATETRHGLYARQNNDHSFDNFRVFRNG